MEKLDRLLHRPVSPGDLWTVFCGAMLLGTVLYAVFTN